MKFSKREEHRVTSIFTYDIPDYVIEEAFGSTERFTDLIQHFSGQENDLPIWEEPTEEECDRFYSFIEDYDFIRHDDWHTARNGVYEISYEVGKE